MRLLLVRHGQTTWNVNGRWQGHANTPLTALGEAQAESLASELAGRAERSWTRIISSDLQRAERTARALANRLDLPMSTDARLRERDVGRWSGLTRSEIEALDAEGLARFESGDPLARPGGGESQPEVYARALDSLRDLVADASPANGQDPKQTSGVILVAHLGVIRALCPEHELDNAGFVEATADEILGRPFRAVIPRRRAL